MITVGLSHGSPTFFMLMCSNTKMFQKGVALVFIKVYHNVIGFGTNHR